MEIRSPVQPATAKPGKSRRYRLLRGMHIETVMIVGDKEGGNCRKIGNKLLIVGEDGVPLCEERVFRPGEIIETDIDLMRYNASDKPPKFGFADEPGEVTLTDTSRVWDSAKETIEQFVARMRNENGNPLQAAPNAAANSPGAVKPPDFARMSEKDLRNYAADVEIDISRAKGRDEILKALQAAV